MQSLALVGSLAYADRKNTQGCLVITEDIPDYCAPGTIISRDLSVNYNTDPYPYHGMYRKSLIVLRRYDGE